MPTTNIKRLRNALHLQISIDSFKVPAFATPPQLSGKPSLSIFYTNDNDGVTKLGKHTAIGFYTVGVQVAGSHNDYNKARQITFAALELINTKRKEFAQVFFEVRESTAPVWLGIGEESGFQMWGFEMKLIGEK